MKAGHPPLKKIHINLSHRVCHSLEFNPLSGVFFLLLFKEKATAPALLWSANGYMGHVPCFLWTWFPEFVSLLKAITRSKVGLPIAS